MSIIAPFLCPCAAPATEDCQYAILKNVSKTYKVPYKLLVAVMMVESKGNLTALNPFDGGSASVGAFQLKMNTAKAMGFHGKLQDLMDFHINAKYAAMYLKYQLDRYNGNWLKATQSYNQGHYDGIFWSEYNQRIMYALENI